MKRATIEIDDELGEALAAYARDQGLPGEIASLVGAVLRDSMAGHGYMTPFRPFTITPIEHDGEESDLSINHDHYLYDWEADGPR